MDYQSQPWKKPRLRPTFTLGLMCQIVLSRSLGSDGNITPVMNSVLTSSTGLSHLYSHPCFSVTYILLLWCPPFPALGELGEEDLATFWLTSHTDLIYVVYWAARSVAYFAEPVGDRFKTRRNLANIPNCSICTVVSIMLYFNPRLFTLLCPPNHDTHTLSGHTWAYTTLVLVDF